jgi:hypothetical protein
MEVRLQRLVGSVQPQRAAAFLLEFAERRARSALAKVRLEQLVDL